MAGFVSVSSARRLRDLGLCQRRGPPPDLFWRVAVVALTFRDDGGVIELTGSVVENPHGLHLNTFRLSAKACLIVCNKIIGRPRDRTMTLFADARFPLMA
jgi:hypothetical protein